MLVDYHIHGLGHQDRAHSLENLQAFVEQGLAVGLTEMGFTEHDKYIGDLDFSLYQQLQELYPQIGIRVGLEVDYRESGDPNWIAQPPFSFDYLIGSVHYVASWPFDHPDHVSGYAAWEADQLYQVYFSLIKKMVQTGHYQIVGHLDLIKVFGLRSEESVVALAGPALQAIQKQGVILEINTAGWYKPIRELYPAIILLEECFRLNIPITLSSDAHKAADVGRDLAKAREIAWKIGYREVTAFQQQKPYRLPL